MIDLHLHSTFSDGTFTPEQLVKMANAAGLKAISITDHDTVDGTQEAVDAGAEFGVRIVPGVELSVFLDDFNFHLLGYHFDWRDQTLHAKLKTLQASRSRRNSVIISKLQKLGLGITEGELQKISSNGQTGRPHIARLLVEKKIVKDIDQAFTLYLRKGKPGYARRFIYHVEEAISLIHESGGCAVLAHPAQISRSIPVLEDLLRHLKIVGLDGLETYYPTQRGSFLKSLRRLAVSHGLIETGGSDYHGDIRPDTAMAGKNNNVVPLTVLDQMDHHFHLNTQ
ncbi:MAG: PHP domain-containing protein [Desulfobulbaceae bacterium]|nr:MAG: PHP domain-containing protein [Desulfobulbaceae bacterium]